MNKKLQKKIEKKLDQLSQILNNITEAQLIVADDPTTWDPDTLYNLVELLKEALQLLDGSLDPFNKGLKDQPNEDGLCWLIDAYQATEEDYE